MKYFTKKWYSGAFKKNNNPYIEEGKQLRKEYREYYKTVEPYLTENTKDKRFHMHDCTLLKWYFCGDDLVMEFDFSQGFTSVNKITFLNAEIIKNDRITTNTDWVYEEVYVVGTGGRYEFHILFHGGGIKEMIIQADDIVLEEGIDDRWRRPALESMKRGGYAEAPDEKGALEICHEVSGGYIGPHKGRLDYHYHLKNKENDGAAIIIEDVGNTDYQIEASDEKQSYYFTKEWYISSQGDLQKIKRKTEEYDRYFKSIQQLLPETLAEDMDMHDKKIIDCGFNGKDFYMTFERTFREYDTVKILFKNARLSGDDSIGRGYDWLYQELNIKEKGYEISILFEEFVNNEMLLKQLIIQFEEISIEKKMRNLGQCVKCRDLISDPLIENFNEVYNNGSYIDGEWYCDNCLPRQQ